MHNPDKATITKLGEEVVEEKYGNLFEMYEKITGDNPYKTPMMIYPAVHYTIGGLWGRLQLADQHFRFVCSRRSQL
ncbi:MAG: hypothetical protein R2784_13150 [Saprospiraceae bacterium]